MAKNKKSSVRWIVSKSSKILPAVFLLAVLGAILSLVNVKFAVASMNLLDSATGKNSMNFVSCVINIVWLLVLDLLLQVVYTVYDIRVRTKYKHHLQSQLFKTVTTRSCPDIASYHSGELINRLTSDINMINSNVVDVIPGTITLLSGIVFSFIEMMRLDLTLSVICLALGPVVLFCAMVYGRRIKPLYKDCQESDGKVRSFMQECIQNIIIVKAFRRERKVQEYADMLRKKNYKLNMKLSYISVLVNIIYYVAMTAAYYLAVAWCAYKISIGIMTVGAFTAIVQLVGSIQSPFRQLAGVVPKVYAACASAERIMEIEEKEEETEDSFNYDPDEFESVAANGLCFSYDGESVLSDASLEIKKGEIVVIHGLSGIGKSTFFKLILGAIKPQSGTLKVNFKNASQDAGFLTRGVFSFVPQGNMLISGTIKENIAFFGDVDEEKIKKASELACIKEYIDTLPDGFDTIIGEKGAGLSEGQIQRIAIARAFYSDAPVMLLDEATSALDEETEVRILENIRSFSDKTCIIITHRPAALEMCDKKVTLCGGKFEKNA